MKFILSECSKSALGSNFRKIDDIAAYFHKQSFGRLADILLCLSDRVFRNEEFDLPLSRKDLSELSGLSVETVIMYPEGELNPHDIAITVV